MHQDRLCTARDSPYRVPRNLCLAKLALRFWTGTGDKRVHIVAAPTRVEGARVEAGATPLLCALGHRQPQRRRGPMGAVAGRLPPTQGKAAIGPGRRVGPQAVRVGRSA